MDNFISNLMDRYDQGLLTRRELIQGLAMLVGASNLAAAAPAAQQAVSPVQATSLSHVSIRVKDVDRSVEWYKKVFGLTFSRSLHRPTYTVDMRVGDKEAFVIREGKPTGCDHFGFGTTKFDRPTVIAQLKKMGIEAIPGNEPFGLHILDPDGFPVQFGGCGDELEDKACPPS